MCRFSMCESRQYGGGGGGGGGGEGTRGGAGASGKRGCVFCKGIFLKSHSFVLVSILVRHCILMRCFTEYV